MPGQVRRLFIPWGDLKPDGKEFNSDGMVVAQGAVPIAGTYVQGPTLLNSFSTPFQDEVYGLHAHFAATWYVYAGTSAALFECDPGNLFATTDKTRAAGGAYSTSSTGGENGWMGTSFGSAIVMTNYVDDPQLLTSPAAANFVKLASSGGANPGMDPKAKFVAPIRNNLFLANLNLSAGFDGLPSGANPTVVCWSQTDNIRQFGSFNVTPGLVGTGYQDLAYDLGAITGLVGGDYGLVPLQRGWVRIDGPPYTFRPIVIGQGCLYPKSILRFDDDVYFWGPCGPSVLRGGEAPVEILGLDSLARTVIDDRGSTAYARLLSMQPRHVSALRDAVNGLIFWSYTTTDGGHGRPGNMVLVYSVRDRRFTFLPAAGDGVTGTGAASPGITFLCQTPPNAAGSIYEGRWCPAADSVAVLSVTDAGSSSGVYYYLAPYSYVFRSMAVTLTRCFQQLDDQLVTRVQRVRPVHSIRSGTTSPTVTVTVASKSRPLGTATTLSFTTADSDGWFPTPTALWAAFHQIGVTFAEQGNGVEPAFAEVEGLEVEFVTGGALSA